MHQILVTVLRAVPPLEIISATEIVGGIPGRGKAIATFRKQVRRELKQASGGFPSSGDQLNGPLAFFGFRWIVATVRKPPSMPIEPCTMDTATMVETFPDLSEKISSLGIVIVAPEDLQEFITAIRIWTPAIPKRRSHKMTKRYDNRPARDGYFGVTT